MQESLGSAWVGLGGMTFLSEIRKFWITLPNWTAPRWRQTFAPDWEHPCDPNQEGAIFLLSAPFCLRLALENVLGRFAPEHDFLQNPRIARILGIEQLGSLRLAL